MSKELLLLVDVLAKEKNLNKEIVFECLEKALAVATKKSFGNESPEIEVLINRTTGKYKTIRKWVIVSDVDFLDDYKELSLSDVQAKYGQGDIGDTVEEEIENVSLDRVSAQIARNIIAQKIRDAEREQVLHEYLSRNRGVVTGRVRKFERGNLIIDCGKVEAIIMRSGLIPKEVFRIGEPVKGYLDKKNLVIKNGRIVLSRSCNEFLGKLLEMNIPEIASGRVEVHGIARDAGVRAKVSVSTVDSRIDAKGSCIGFRNQRIDSITGELSGEKVDIISYDSNLAQYAINALAPAEINSIVIDEEKHSIEVVVEDDKLGLAIGPDGVNVRLAGKLLGHVINVFGKTDAKKQHEIHRDDLVKMFNDSLGIDDDISEILVENEFSNLEEVAYVDIQELISLPDFDEDIAVELQSRAKNKLLSKKLKYKDDIDNLASELSGIVKFSSEVLLSLVENKITNIQEFADLSGDELKDIIAIDLETANKLILKAREVSGYFN